jgi:hypothetical protein
MPINEDDMRTITWLDALFASRKSFLPSGTNKIYLGNFSKLLMELVYISMNVLIVPTVICLDASFSFSSI